MKVGAVLYWESRGYSGPQGTTVGADGAGRFVRVFTGNPGRCELEAHRFLDALRKTRVIKMASIVTNYEEPTGFPIHVFEVED